MSTGRYPKIRRRGYPKWYSIDRVRPNEGVLLGSLHPEKSGMEKRISAVPSGRDEDLNGPYFYRRWRDEEDTQRKEYVPNDKVDEVQAEVEKRRRRLTRERKERAEWMNRNEGKGLPRHVWTRKNRRDGPEGATLADTLSALL